MVSEEGLSVLLQAVRDLERIERVAVRDPMDSRDRVEAQVNPRTLSKDLAQMRGLQRAERDRVDAPVEQPFVGEPGFAGPLRGQHTDGLALEPTKRELECPGGGRVEPLHVVDGDDHGL